MMRYIVFFIVWQITVWAHETWLLRYGANDFLIDNDSVTGFSIGVDYEQNENDRYTHGFFVAHADLRDPKEHDSDHIPIWFRGDYVRGYNFLRYDDFVVKGDFDFLWKMNTQSGIEQSLKTGINTSFGYENADKTQCLLHIGIGEYYLEIDDDAPRPRGYERNDLTYGFTPYISVGTFFGITAGRHMRLEASARYWGDNDTWFEKKFSAAMRYTSSDKTLRQIVLSVDHTVYNLDLFQTNAHTLSILPWDNDTLIEIVWYIPLPNR